MNFYASSFLHLDVFVARCCFLAQGIAFKDFSQAAKSAKLYTFRVCCVNCSKCEHFDASNVLHFQFCPPYVFYSKWCVLSFGSSSETSCKGFVRFDVFQLLLGLVLPTQNNNFKRKTQIKLRMFMIPARLKNTKDFAFVFHFF